MPSVPVCWPSTQASQTTVASIGNAIAVLKVAIHTPGLGSMRASLGQALAARYGNAMPTPSAANSVSACTEGSVKARPSAAPMKGAVQGEAMATASTPVSAESASGWRMRIEAKPLGNRLPKS